MVDVLIEYTFVSDPAMQWPHEHLQQCTRGNLLLPPLSIGDCAPNVVLESCLEIIYICHYLHTKST